jgi:hypothetical protein
MDFSYPVGFENDSDSDGADTDSGSGSSGSDTEAAPDNDGEMAAAGGLPGPEPASVLPEPDPAPAPQAPEPVPAPLAPVLPTEHAGLPEQLSRDQVRALRENRSQVHTPLPALVPSHE